MPKLPFICEQANMVESLHQVYSAFGDHIEIKLKSGQVIVVEFEGVIRIHSSVPDGMRADKAGASSINLVWLIDEEFTQGGY